MNANAKTAGSSGFGVSLWWKGRVQGCEELIIPNDMVLKEIGHIPKVIHTTVDVG